MNDWLYSFLILNPSKVLYKFEFWRLLTYPFVANHPVSFVFALAAFYLPGSKLEDYFPKNMLLALSGLLLILHGLIQTLFNFNQNIGIGGFDCLSIFLFAMSAFVYKNKKLKLWNNFYVNYSIFAIIIISVSSLLLFGYNSVYANYKTVWFTTLIFSVVSASVIYYRINKIKELEKEELKSSIPEPVIEYKELHPSYVPGYQQLKKSASMLREKKQYYFLQDKNMSDEEKVDCILDKISAEGKESLSTEELNFLTEYSNNID